jgi:L-arabinonolactonase
LAMVQVTCVLDSKSFLGEGPLWDPRDQALWWVDIKKRLIHRTDPASGVTAQWRVPEDLGCLAVREQGGLVVTMTSGFYFFDPVSGHFDPIIDPEADQAENRFNDGKVDRQGRFWAATMHDPQTLASGSLYRLDPDLSCHRMVEGIHVSNGLAWSPDSRVMYYADSLAYAIWAWDFDAAAGEIANRRLFMDTRPTGGLPDGATVDAEGCYWLTLARTGNITRYDPNGRPMQTIALPTDLPTCVIFGGADLDILDCTSATLGRGEKELVGQVGAGGLFAIDAGVKGMPEAHFRG